jgi:hypothetical protein
VGEQADSEWTEADAEAEVLGGLAAWQADRGYWRALDAQHSSLQHFASNKVEWQIVPVLFEQQAQEYGGRLWGPGTIEAESQTCHLPLPAACLPACSWLDLLPISLC